MTEPGLQICLKTAKKYFTFGSFFSMLTISESLSVIGVTMLTIAISLVNSIFELALSNRKYTFTQKGTFETIKNSLLIKKWIRMGILWWWRRRPEEMAAEADAKFKVKKKRESCFSLFTLISTSYHLVNHNLESKSAL